MGGRPVSFSFCSSVRPSISGSTRSVRTTAGCCVSTRLSASSPDEAVQAFALGRLVVDDEDLAGLHLVASAWAHGSLAWSALLNTEVVDDALDALRLPRELLGSRLLLGRIDRTVKVNSGVVGVNVH